jgi:hypothetical protein
MTNCTPLKCVADVQCPISILCKRIRLAPIIPAINMHMVSALTKNRGFPVSFSVDPGWRSQVIGLPAKSLNLFRTVNSLNNYWRLGIVD